MNYLSDEKQIELYQNIGNSYSAWLHYAQRLLEAADILKEKTLSAIETTFKSFNEVDNSIINGVMIQAPQLMLRGFAIECLFKALWVKRGKPIVVNGKYIRIPGTNDHDLIQLAKAVQISMSRKEIDVLKRLSYYVKSGGRYPVPVQWEYNKIQHQYRGFGPLSHWGGTDYKTCELIVDKLKQELDR